MAAERRVRIGIAVAVATCIGASFPAGAEGPPPAPADGGASTGAPGCRDFVPSRDRVPAFAAAPSPAASDAPTVCEGFVEQAVSEPFLELVSLTRGSSRLDAAGPVRLTQAATPLARVVLQPRSGTPLYRVEAALASGRPLSWDPAAMLHATGLNPRDIAFLARAPEDGSRRLRAAPLTLQAATLAAPAAASQPSPANVVYAVIRTSVDVSSLAWRAYDAGQQVAVPFHEAADSSLYAWQTYSLALPVATDGHDRVLEVVAQGPGGRPLPLLVVTVLGEHR